MTRIFYERPDNDNGDASLEMQGTGPELLRAVVQIVYAMQDRLGMNVDRFAVTLPEMVRMEKEALRETITIDKALLRKEGGE